jgi:hypothetical protein
VTVEFNLKASGGELFEHADQLTIEAAKI